MALQKVLELKLFYCYLYPLFTAHATQRTFNIKFEWYDQKSTANYWVSAGVNNAGIFPVGNPPGKSDR